MNQDLNPFAELQRALQKAAEQQDELGRNILAITESTVRTLQEIGKQVSTWQLFDPEELERINRSLESLPDSFDELEEIVGRFLVERGWFLFYHLSLSDGITFFRLLQDGRREDAEAFAFQKAKEMTNHAYERLTKHFPEREYILKQAFKAHDNGMYAVSIPTMLTQWDGIFHHIFVTNFFERKYSFENVKKALTKRRGPDLVKAVLLILKMYIEPLSEWGTFTESRVEWSKRAKAPSLNTLNRHAVLHGYDLNYPTEANSYRVILMLDLLVSVKIKIDRHQQTTLMPEP